MEQAACLGVEAGCSGVTVASQAVNVRSVHFVFALCRSCQNICATCRIRIARPKTFRQQDADTTLEAMETGAGDFPESLDCHSFDGSTAPGRFSTRCECPKVVRKSDLLIPGDCLAETLYH